MCPVTQDYHGYHGIDTMLVCLNGHVVTEAAEVMVHQRQDFCSSCGKETIFKCPECGATIPGKNWDSGVAFIGFDFGPPKYCSACGTSYPWQQLAIANAIEVFELGDLDQVDIKIVKSAMPDLVADTPKTQAATLRLSRILAKLPKATYDVAIKVVSDLVSESVKKGLGLK